MRRARSLPTPMQPIRVDKDGVIRFRENPLVVWLLDIGPSGRPRLNELHASEVGERASLADWEQFNQLIGYSVSGFGGHSHTRPETAAKADRAAARLLRKRRK